LHHALGTIYPYPMSCRSHLAALVLALLAAPTVAVKLTRGQVIGGVCAAAVPACCEAYARLPPSWSDADLPALPPLEEEHVIIVLHGAGGPDANVKRIATALRKSSNGKAQVIEYSWLPFVGDQLQAPYNAQRVGRHLATEISSSHRPLARLHVVGISVGAFAADELVADLAKRRGGSGIGSTELKMTLLDPFTARGLPGLARPSSAYGVTAFGKHADLAECVLNTDDPVPSTALPLRHAVNFDITDNTERASFVPLDGDSLHSWPAAWYGMHPTALDGLSTGMQRGSTRPILE